MLVKLILQVRNFNQLKVVHVHAFLKYISPMVDIGKLFVYHLIVFEYFSKLFID